MKTGSGFEFEIAETTLNNMELVDALAEADEGNHLAISRVCTLLLGKEQKKKLYDHVRLEDGSVPIDAVTNILVEIISSSNTAKNS